jgi:hypothetical protein
VKKGLQEVSHWYQQLYQTYAVGIVGLRAYLLFQNNNDLIRPNRIFLKATYFMFVSNLNCPDLMNPRFEQTSPTPFSLSSFYCFSYRSRRQLNPFHQNHSNLIFLHRNQLMKKLMIFAVLTVFSVLKITIRTDYVFVPLPARFDELCLKISILHISTSDDYLCSSTAKVLLVRFYPSYFASMAFTNKHYPQ